MKKDTLTRTIERENTPLQWLSSQKVYYTKEHIDISIAKPMYLGWVLGTSHVPYLFKSIFRYFKSIIDKNWPLQGLWLINDPYSDFQQFEKSTLSGRTYRIPNVLSAPAPGKNKKSCILPLSF